jgi:hypothetical protein
VTTDDLDAVTEAAIGQPLDTLDVALALDVADTLRAVIGALPPTTPRDAHLPALLSEAAELVERRAGIT